jgi:hypothetical protein
MNLYMPYETSVHELDHRAADGVDVALLWDEFTNRVSVTVSDQRTGDFFEVLVTAADNPLDVFKHPFAYAALRGIPYSSGLEREPIYA